MCFIITKVIILSYILLEILQALMKNMKSAKL